MKILVLSDSHGNARHMQQVFENIGEAFQVVIHLGDCDDDMNFFKQHYPWLQYYGVKGNCDHGNRENSEAVIQVTGKKLFITHGHTYHIKSSYDRIVYAAQEKEVEICLFGHSHLPAVFYESGILFMNPGSISLPRGIAYPSYGVIDISTETGAINPSVVAIEKNGYRILGAPYI